MISFSAAILCTGMLLLCGNRCSAENGGFTCGFDDSSTALDPVEDRTGHEDFNAQPWHRWTKNSEGKIEVPYIFDPSVKDTVKPHFRKYFKIFEDKMENIAFKEEQVATPLSLQLKVIVSCSNRLCSNGKGGAVQGSSGWCLDELNDWKKCYGISLTMIGEPYKYENDDISGSNPQVDEIWYTILQHEIFHVFGIIHTQRRKDRGDYIEVFEGNITSGALSQYEICEDCPIPPGIAYECDSIMHYPNRIGGKQVCKNLWSGGRDCYNKLTLKAKDEATCPSFGNENPTDNDWKALEAVVDVLLRDD